MKINEPNRTSMINAYNKNQSPVSNQSKATRMGRDEVKISDEALELLRSYGDIDASPTSKARLQELSQQVEQGTYHVPSEKIAEKFISFWLKG
ncbi:flagellar biosynthesis anti-sigma factor FlgM [Brevibacillus humidisoli]|uniref:flagellar biosynthesis anti-sigma factor FlgM n=1 Tax=Brevibacillus humidisoli TaxID=2895522 RepID=UPI001E370BEC|nr:flagellar biosynthesis anti-sigma factor FlgM [Brevibacillus humidisoli]UFJ40062.1 flagellar biosynthesis anti-sigma factor FlgM [Brevibacillus humidisoli]